MTCDGNDNCGDNSDEILERCSSGLIYLSDIHLPLLSKINDDNENEYDSSRFIISLESSCLRNQFQCSNNDCVAGTSKCNGLYECDDKSDEENCNCN